MCGYRPRKSNILTIAEESFDKYVRMSGESPLTLRRDHARTDFAIIESDLEAIYARLARHLAAGQPAEAAVGLQSELTVLGGLGLRRIGL
jgi:hypothetical protein